MKHTFHKKLATPKARLAVAVLGVIMIALPGVIFAVEDGLGTNVVRNIKVQTTGVIDLDGTAITNWNQVGSTAVVAELQAKTSLWNTAVIDSTSATGNVAELQGKTSAWNTAVIDSTSATGDVAVLQGATNALNTAVTSVSYQVTNDLFNATNALNTAVNALNANTTRWDNAVVIKEGAAGVEIAYSNLCYYNLSDSKWYKANATNSTTASGLLGLALGTVAADAPVSTVGLLLNGQCTNLWGFTPGSIIYMDTNAGAICASMPTGTNNIVRIVGYAISTTNIYFNPDRTYIQITGQ